MEARTGVGPKCANLVLGISCDQPRVSADVHVHMNYGGTYRNTPRNLVRQAAAEDLDLVFNLVVNATDAIGPDGHLYLGSPGDRRGARFDRSTGVVVLAAYWGLGRGPRRARASRRARACHIHKVRRAT